MSGHGTQNTPSSRRQYAHGSISRTTLGKVASIRPNIVLVPSVFRLDIRDDRKICCRLKEISNAVTPTSLAFSYERLLWCCNPREWLPREGSRIAGFLARQTRAGMTNSLRLSFATEMAPHPLQLFPLLDLAKFGIAEGLRLLPPMEFVQLE